MSIAWATVAVVVLLLPGFLFSVGLYIPERFTRDTAPKSPLGQLAGVVVVSLGIHGIYFVIQGWICGALPFWPCVNLQYVLAMLQVGEAGAVPLRELAANVTRYRFGIVLYLLASSFAGLGVGWGVGKQIVNGRMRWLAQHDWVLDLPATGKHGYTFAHILSQVEQFGLSADGRFSYIVLSKGERAYLRLEETGSRIDSETHRMGATEESGGSGGNRKLATHLVIAGDNIANVVFDRYEISIQEGDRAELERLLGELVRKTAHQVFVENFPHVATHSMPPKVSQEPPPTQRDAR